MPDEKPNEKNHPVYSKLLQSRDQFGQYLNEHELSNVGVEIGVFTGVFSRILLTSWPGILWMVDAWDDIEGYDDTLHWEGQKKPKRSTEFTKQDWEDALTQCKFNVEEFGERARLLRMSSMEAARKFQDGSLDFVYIDANHTYKAVVEDLRLWWPKLKEGGLFSGHDYLTGIRNGNNVGVKQAVDEFAKEVDAEVMETSEKTTSHTWFWFKIDRKIDTISAIRQEQAPKVQKLPPDGIVKVIALIALRHGKNTIRPGESFLVKGEDAETLISKHRVRLE